MIYFSQVGNRRSSILTLRYLSCLVGVSELQSRVGYRHTDLPDLPFDDVFATNFNKHVSKIDLFLWVHSLFDDGFPIVRNSLWIHFVKILGHTGRFGNSPSTFVTIYVIGLFKHRFYWIT